MESFQEVEAAFIVVDLARSTWSGASCLPFRLCCSKEKKTFNHSYAHLDIATFNKQNAACYKKKLLSDRGIEKILSKKMRKTKKGGRGLP